MDLKLYPNLRGLIRLVGLWTFVLGFSTHAQESPFSVEIKVEATGDDMSSARTKALAMGEKQAYDKLKSGPGGKSLPAQVPAGDISQMVSGYEVLEERASSNRYRARLRYHFDDELLKKMGFDSDLVPLKPAPAPTPVPLQAVAAQGNVPQMGQTMALPSAPYTPLNQGPVASVPGTGTMCQVSFASTRQWIKFWQHLNAHPEIQVLSYRMHKKGVDMQVNDTQNRLSAMAMQAGAKILPTNTGQGLQIQL